MESGIILRSPDGGYSERHLPLSAEDAYTLTARDRDEVVGPPTTTDAGVAAPRSRATLARSRDEIDRVELEPFRAAIAAGTRAVMTGHLVKALEQLEL